MDNTLKMLGIYACGAAGTAAGIASAVVLGLSAPVSLVIGYGVALGGLFAASQAD